MTRVPTDCVQYCGMEVPTDCVQYCGMEVPTDCAMLWDGGTNRLCAILWGGGTNRLCAILWDGGTNRLCNTVGWRYQQTVYNTAVQRQKQYSAQWRQCLWAMPAPYIDLSLLSTSLTMRQFYLSLSLSKRFEDGQTKTWCDFQSWL